MKYYFNFLLSLSFLGFSLAVPWDSYNDPRHFSESFNYKFSSLPLGGKLKTVPWSDSYWPSFESGIAHRWNTDIPHDFEYQLYTKSELLQMSQEQLRTLSPAEKYDIYSGRYDYPTVHSEWKRTSPQDAKWEGLCHGWAPASLFYKQPNSVTLKNSDGISVPFGSSDIKALLIYFVAEYDEQHVSTPFVAERCKYDIKAQPEYENTPECADINAGSFHTIISNEIGINSQGFVVDRDRSFAVWNQPVFFFNTTIMGYRQPPPNVRAAQQVVIETVMAYGKETPPQWDSHEPHAVSETYQYYLDLDANGNIIGGDHVTWDRPDFEWMSRINDFSGYFDTLKQIYSSSVSGGEPLPVVSRVYPPTRNVTLLHHHSGMLRLHNYPSNYRAYWSIVPRHAKSISLDIHRFSTERHRDVLRIYEGEHGEGALIAVLHGDLNHQTIVINAPAAFLRFSSDSSVSKPGFVISYAAH